MAQIHTAEGWRERHNPKVGGTKAYEVHDRHIIDRPVDDIPKKFLHLMVSSVVNAGAWRHAVMRSALTKWTTREIITTVSTTSTRSVSGIVNVSIITPAAGDRQIHLTLVLTQVTAGTCMRSLALL